MLVRIRSETKNFYPNVRTVNETPVVYFYLAILVLTLHSDIISSDKFKGDTSQMFPFRGSKVLVHYFPKTPSKLQKTNIVIIKDNT